MTGSRLLLWGEEAGLALRAGQDALWALGQRATWTGAALLLLGRLVFVLALAGYPGGPVSRLLDGALEAAGGESALHFPHAYAVFPRLFGLLEPPTSWLFALPGAVLLVAAFPRILAERPGVRGLDPVALGRLPAAWIATLPGALLAAAGPAVRDAVAAKIFGLAGLVAGAALAAASLALAALFTYALPAVVLGGAGPARALASSAELASHFPRVTLLLLAVEAVAIALATPAPAAMIPQFESMNPEWVPALLALVAVGLTALDCLLLLTFSRIWMHANGTVGE